MGTHPIFESDFDCLTEKKRMNRLNNRSRIIYTGCFCSFCAAKERLLLLVNGHSMAPTINHDDLIITRPFLPKLDSLNKNDVIIAEDPEQEGKTILKRITHLAGEKAFWKRRIYHDGWQEIGEIEIKDGFVWIEGDNKERSIDSRTFGPIQE